MTRLLFILPLLLLAPTAYSQLLINEVMSVNEGTITDEQGEQEDWIEIYNAGNSPVDLGGFYLSDDPLELQKYEIPTTQANLTIIPAKGFLLLWADKDTEQGINHLDFKLSNGETLFLVDAAGNVISSITPPTLLGDESYGRLQDGGSEWQIFSQTASPLASNNDPTRAEVFFSKNTQLFTNTITVELSANNTNGQIRYTTDGTIPIATSSLYTTPLTFTTNIDLKATFFFNAGGASHTTSARYVKMESDLANFSSDLPLIVIHTDDQVLNGSEMKNTFWSVIEPNNNGRAHGNDPASFSGKVAMRIRGATSAGFPKKQWRCELRNEDDSDLKTELLGMPAESDWVLYAPGRYDRALINNALMYEMSNRLGTYAPRTRFVEVYYNQDGVLDQNDYWGIYILTEKIKIDENRVDIDKPDVTNDKLNTFIVRYDRDNLFTTTYTQNNYAAWTRYYDIKDPDPAGLSTTQINNVAAEFELFENKLAATDLSYRQYVDMHSFVNSHILKALTREPDGFCVSYFLFKDNNGLINSGPIWDFDRAINSTDTRSASPLDWGAGNARYWNPDNPYRSIHINELVKDPLYRTKFYDAWFDWRENNILNTNQLNTLIDSMATVLAEAQVRNFNRWNTTEYAPRYGGFQGEINAMKEWFATRSEWMDGQLLNPPTFSPNGGTVTANQNITITNTIGTGTIYYTTDGTDPMLADGTLAPNAQIYSGTLRVSNRGMNTITARIKTDTDWGAIARQHFYIQANYSGLLINEIHYAPKDSILSNDTIASKNFSFVEVVNTTQEQLSLVGTRFTKGIDLTIEKILLIEPGGYVVFAEDEDWFEARYGFAPDGQFSGMLDPDGEELILEDPFGNVLDNVRFNDKNPWDEVPAKAGFSLELLHPYLDNEAALNWFRSDNLNGTPRAANSRICSQPAASIIINEINYNSDNTNFDPSDWIELYNPNSFIIDLSGWTIYNNDTSFQIPAGTTIAPNAYLVLLEEVSTFSVSFPEVPSSSYLGDIGFSLSNKGDRISLFDENKCLSDYVIYDDETPWVSEPDGAGATLALRNPNLDNAQASAWEASLNLFSTFTHGSPGAINNCTVGQACCDGNAQTINDTYDANCNCNGTLINELPPVVLCDDNNPLTIQDVYDGNTCACKGIIPEQTVCIQIIDGMDDVEENVSSGAMNMLSSDLDLGSDDNESFIVGLRFQNSPIPTDAIVQNAYLQFTADEVSTQLATNIQIKGESSNNPNPHFPTSYDVSSRTTTATTVTWDIPAWETIGERESKQRSTDISDVLQELVDQSNYHAGNAIALRLSGTGERPVDSYDGSSEDAPELCVTYSTGQCVFGYPCDDGNLNTEEDTYDENCKCIGTDVSLQAKVFLEGFYDGTTNQMHRKLGEKGLLPLSQPFNQLPWSYMGTESVNTIPNSAVDWVLVMARDATGVITNQAVGFVNQAGDLISTEDRIGIPLGGAINQFISVHTRSHLAVMSATPFTGAQYDFTTSSNQAKGTNQLKSVAGKYVLHAGDYDSSGIINNTDFNNWKTQSAILNQYLSIDGDGNGIINAADYNLWINNRSKVGEQVIRY